MLKLWTIVAGVIVMFGTASAQGVPRNFVPGDLLVGFRSPGDADDVMRRLRQANPGVQVRGMPVQGVSVSKVADNILSIHIDFPDSVKRGIAADPASELTVIEELAARLKMDSRVTFAGPNWIRSLDPQTTEPQRAPLRRTNGSSGDGAGVSDQLKFVVSKDGPDPKEQGAPNDELYLFQWDLLPPPRGMNAVGAWKVTKGRRDIVVAVIDTGIIFAQSDVNNSGHVLPGLDFVTRREANSCVEAFREPSRDAADPGDDNIHCMRDRQVDAMAAKKEFTDRDRVQSPSWHGTHVAGTVGAVGTGNGIGIAGVAWDVTILPVRVLSYHGGTDKDIARAMRWAAGLHVDGVADNANPADIINLSLGGVTFNPAGSKAGVAIPCSDSIFSKTVEEITRMKGAVIVAAAGNGAGVRDGKYCLAGPDCHVVPVDVKDVTPAGCPGIISVAAGDMRGHLAPYSNFGNVSVMAPGGDTTMGGAVVDTAGHRLYNTGLTFGGILGSVGPTHGPFEDPESDSSFSWYEGTSQAAPHVSGAIALLLSAHPELRHKPALIQQALRQALVPLPQGACPASESCGPGLLDAEMLVKTSVTAR